jgi:hypothetical protein
MLSHKMLEELGLSHPHATDHMEMVRSPLGIEPHFAATGFSNRDPSCGHPFLPLLWSSSAA